MPIAGPTTLWPAFESGGLKIDFVQHRITVDGREVTLTATEYALLTYLAQNAGMVLIPDQILEKVWGEGYAGENHLLQVNIGRLRQKLGDASRNPRYLVTRSGIGYMLKNAPSAPGKSQPSLF